MPRKQLGAVDDALLARVDACAADLGQTRRVFTERALEAALSGHGYVGTPTEARPQKSRPSTSGDTDSYVRRATPPVTNNDRLQGVEPRKGFRQEAKPASAYKAIPKVGKKKA